VAQQDINLGVAANDGTGDDYRSAFTKTQENFDELFLGFGAIPTRRVTINSLGDFPDPVAGIISLNQNTQYLIGDDIDMGANTLNLADGTAVSGIESIAVNLTYTGTGDMFTGTDVTMRINGLSIICATGRFLNWNDSLGKVLRINDCTIVCDRLALITGNGSSVRFTAASTSTITTSGFSFVGSFRIFLYETSLANVLAGDLIDLGVAVFDGINVQTITANLASGTTFLSGLSSSGNISTGGVGAVFSTTISGTGSALSGITVNDALWQFLLNDDIADTRPDGLLSLQSNTSDTIISAGGVYAIVAGVWTVERTSQFTGTSSGRLTYNGGKDATLPVSFALSVEPSSGTNKLISARYALNGVTVTNSTRTIQADAGSPIALGVVWQDVLSTSDFIEVFVTSDDGSDVLVSSAIARAN